MSLLNKVKEESEIIYSKVDIINSIYNYNYNFNIILCNICKITINSNKEATSHLDLHYKIEELSIIKEDLLLKLNTLIIKDSKGIKDITPYIYYFKDLLDYIGYKCLKCEYLTINYKALRNHLNIDHLIKSNIKGPNPNFFRPYYIYPIILQTLSNNKKTLNYFITSKNTNIKPLNNIDNILYNFNNNLKEKILKNNNKEGLTIKETTSFLYNSKFKRIFY